MFGKKDNMEVKTGEKKKSKKKTILIVVVVLFLFLAIAGSDDNQSKNTVATSTNAVETENTTENIVAEEEPDVMDGITEEDYIASNQERTGGEESQEPTTKDSDTTIQNTDKNNTNNNDKSFTSRDEIFDNVKVHEEDTTQENNSSFNKVSEEEAYKTIATEVVLKWALNYYANDLKVTNVEVVEKDTYGRWLVKVRLNGTNGLRGQFSSESYFVPLAEVTPEGKYRCWTDGFGLQWTSTITDAKKLCSWNTPLKEMTNTN